MLGLLVGNQPAGGVVPQALAAVEIELKAPCGEPAPLQGDASEAALGPVRSGGAQTHQIGWGEPLEVHRREAVFEAAVGWGQVKPFAVEEGTHALPGAEALVAHRVQDGPDHRLAAADQGQGDGEQRESAGEVAGAVQWIQAPDPGVCIAEAAYLLVAVHLLGEQGDLGGGDGQLGGDCGLGGEVRLGHQAAVGLLARGDVAETGKDLSGRGGSQDATDLIELRGHGYLWVRRLVAR